MELTAIEDFEKLGKDNEMFAELARICKRIIMYGVKKQRNIS